MDGSVLVGWDGLVVEPSGSHFWSSESGNLSLNYLKRYGKDQEMDKLRSSTVEWRSESKSPFPVQW